MKKTLGKIFGILFLVSGPGIYFEQGQDPDLLISAVANVLIGLVILYFTHKKPSEKKSKKESFKNIHKETQRRVQEQNQSNIEMFNPDRMITSNVGYDSDNRLIGVKTFRKFNQVFEVDKVVSYELVEDGRTVTGGGLGASVAGGVLFGGAGAIVGAITGKKKDKSKVDKVQIKLNTSDLDNPVIYIDLLLTTVKRTSTLYSNAIKEADIIISSLDIILNTQEAELKLA